MNLLQDITLDKWLSTIKELNTGSAAGPSSIDYRIIKHLPMQVHHILITIANASLKSSIIPSKWKLSNIFPIPKPHAFEFRMENARPIVLLDTCRKSITKLLTNRISLIISTHHVLKGFNFCELKEEDTLIPLSTMNNIIEDARANNKELWIATQDMKKAYDSISLDSLRLALERISLSSPIVR